MPKFTYSAAKGIEQTSGQGFIVQDVAIAPSVKTFASSDFGDGGGTGSYNFATNSVGAEAVYYVDADEALTLIIPDGAAAGEEKLVILSTDTTAALTLQDSSTTQIKAWNPGGTAGEVLVFVWNGTTWAELS